MTTPARDEVVDLETFGRQYYLQDNYPGVWDEVINNHCLARTYRDKRPESTNNPIYEGWRAPSGFDHSGSTSVAPNATITWDESSLAGTIHRFAEGGMFFTAYKPELEVVSQRMLDLALIKALKKLKASNVNLGVALAERRETAGMLIQTVNRVSETIRRFKYDRPARAIREMWKEQGKPGFPDRLVGPSRKAADAWLELQYGWKPALSDLHGACQDIANRDVSGAPPMCHVIGVQKESDTLQEWWSGAQIFEHWLQSLSTVRKEKVARYRMDYYLTNPIIQTLSQVGLTNPLEIIWERVPYSFVIDWFLPVGDFLNVLDADQGWDFKAGSVSTYASMRRNAGRLQVINREDGGIPGIPGSFRVLSQTRDGSQAAFDFRRTVLHSSPIPDLPRLKNPISPGHIANSLALLAGSLGRTIPGENRAWKRLRGGKYIPPLL